MIDVWVNLRTGIGIGFGIGVVAFILGFALSSSLRLFDVGVE